MIIIGPKRSLPQNGKKGNPLAGYTRMDMPMPCCHADPQQTRGAVMTRCVSFFLLLVLLIGLSVQAAPLQQLRQLGPAALYVTPEGTYHVVNLYGDWQAMGEQYGSLAGPLLREFHERICADLSKRGVDASARQAFAKAVFDQYGPEVRALILGMGKGSGLGREKAMELNAGMMLLTGAVLGGEPPSACSGLAAWGQRTTDGHVVFGRNWDILREPMRRYMKYLGVAVFHPKDGVPFANVHPLGNMYLESGLNRNGVFLELNNGEHSDPTEYEDREDTSSVLVRVLSRAKSLDDAVRRLCAVPADLAYIIQVADADRAVSVERATFGCRVREGASPGMLAAYNSFVPPYPEPWQGRINPPPPQTQDPRLRNIRTMLANPEIKGRINAETMRELMEVDVADGGAMFGGTVLQIVARPSERILWIRGVDYSDWETVELAPLLGGIPAVK
ncbi:hypothetical protein F8A88_15645 [Pseudodesulfovibrio senegalensis]|uniref:Uncharacterized protein n=2 Tax=Pseudodesulfovibrio senegalensis TaxID=1721087 RepID=A0A6N6MZ05_9BACT|nr:hypothetical protein F8A88_15645 [Pseudodesulfovibrio senegalensis]